MKKNKELRIMIVIALVISVISLAFAYVAMNLSIKSRSVGLNWDVNFSDLDEEVLGDTESVFPTVSSTSINGIDVTFKKPGDSISYQFKVKNTGNINARLEVLKITSPICVTNDNTNCNRIKYDFKYLNGDAVKVGDTLAFNTNKDVILTITYDENATFTRNSKITLSNFDLILLFEQE